MFEMAAPDVADAMTCVGDVTVWPRIGVETDKTGPLTVMPWVEQTVEGPRLRIREDAGYTQTSTLLREAL